MRLREQIVKANLLVREASYIAEELDKRTEYKVTLQIPASSLDANRKVRLPLMEKTKLLLDKISSVLFRCGGGGVCPCPHPCPPQSRLFVLALFPWAEFTSHHLSLCICIFYPLEISFPMPPASPALPIYFTPLLFSNLFKLFLRRLSCWIFPKWFFL